MKKNNLIIFMVFLAMTTGMLFIGAYLKSETLQPKEKLVVEPITIHDTIIIHDTLTIITPCNQAQLNVVTGTKYQPVEAQCDATPLNTADGSYIDTTLLEIYDLQWCALSQDLLWFNGGPYHYGDFIRVYSPNEDYSGLWQIHDCMNKRYTNRIDFLTWFNWPTLGVQEDIVIQKVEI